MAVSQKLTLTQLESQGYHYQVRVLWLSNQTGSSYNDRERTAYLYYSINGGAENTVAVQYTLPLRTEKVILETVISVPQLPDGTATLAVRTWMNTHISAGVVELSETMEMEPTASTITASDAWIGSASAVKIYRSSIAHTHSVRYVFGDQTGYLTENGSTTAEEILLTAENIPFVIPESFYAQIPNDTQGTCYLYCTTYVDGTQVGEVQEASFTALANEELCMPLVTGTVVDVNEITTALTGDERVLVRYHSNALCTITPEAQHYASIKKMWVDAIELTEPTWMLPSIKQEFVMFFAQDSRGYSNAFLCDYVYIPYTHLTSTPQVERDDPTSGNATLRYTGLCFSGSFGEAENDLSFAYQIDSGEFIPAEIEYSVTEGRYTAVAKLTGLDYRKVYTITARVSDRLETVEKKLTLKKGVPVFDWGEEDFVFHVPVTIEGDLKVTGSLTVNGEETVAPDGGDETEKASTEVEYVVEKDIQNRDSVCVIEETGASIDSGDNSAYFSAEYIVVQNDTYKVDKATMLSLPNKKLVGNGSVAWKDWDSIHQGWKDAENADMLSSALKARYADDPVYLSMKLPSEANFKVETIDRVIRPGMRASDYAATDLVTVNNIAAIYAVDYENLPDEVVICIGNMSLYTLSKEPNAKWRLHDKCSIPEGYGMFSLPWNSANETTTSIPDTQISIRDNYIRFTLSKNDFSPVTDMVENSVGRALHFWGKHQGLDLSNTAAIITFLEVWTETEGVDDNLYVAIGCDRKNATRTKISQLFWGRNVLLDKEKKIIAGHNISDALYDQLRDTPNDPRLVYADYASVHGSDYDLALLKSQVEKDLADKTTKMNACFSTLEITEVTETGININPGVYERGYIKDGNDLASYEDRAFRTKGYIKVEPGRNIALYFDKAAWNINANGNPDNGQGIQIYEYDISKTFIRGTDTSTTPWTGQFPSYLNNGSYYTLSENTRYIRICFCNWHTTFETPELGFKLAIYYLENAQHAFVEYYADIEAVYGVKGDSIILTAPNGSKFSLSISDDGALRTKLIT